MKPDPLQPTEDLQDLQERVRQLENLLRARFRKAGLDADLHPEINHETALLLQELGDSIPTPLFFKNREGHFTFCNRALLDLLGLEHERVAGHAPADLLPVSFSRELDDGGRRLLESGREQVEECHLPVTGGRTLQVRIHRSLLRDGDGRVVGLVGAVLDQSLQLRTLHSLAASEARYRGLFEAALDAIFVMDGEQFIECNPASARIFGRKVEELKGMRPMELSPTYQPDGRSSLDKAVEKIKAAFAGEKQFFEWVHLRADGSPFDAEVSLSPLAQDGHDYVLAIVRDITDRKQAEAALRASEEFNRGMIQHAPMGVMYVDLDSVLVYENPAMERMMGVPRGTTSRALGRSLAELPGLSHMPVKELLARVAQGEVIRNLDVEYLSVYDVRTQLQVQISPHCDATGKVIGAIFLIQDVTELRNLEQQLRQAQKLDAIGSLAGGIAHDFNNLLTGINGNAELAMQHLDDGEQVRRCLTDQLAITQRAGELTRRLLTFSRQQETAPRPILLSHLLNDLEMMLRRLIGEAVDLRLTCPSDLWGIRADPGQIEQVIVNMVVNARDAMPDGGRLDIVLRNQDISPGQARRVSGLAAGPIVMMEVTDTGCGIDDAISGRIFEPFFTTKEIGKGTGLGLSIAYAILKKCGGGVTVSSKVGLGTTFRLYFPSIGVLAPEQPAAKATSEELRRGHETILVIEDEPAVRELSVRLLEHCGYHVLSAADGPSAIALAQQGKGPVDLIFSDVIMPGMSGPVAVRHLMDLWPGTRVLFCSGYTDGELSRHDLSPSSGGGLLIKPFTMASLSQRVRQALDGGPSS